MAGLIYLLDTNVIGDYLNNVQSVVHRLEYAIRQGDVLCLCEPVYYEVMRGLLKTNSTRKRAVFDEKLLPLLIWIDLQREDWLNTAHQWAYAQSQGKQLSDVDLLLASIAKRIGAILVTSDDDFTVLQVQRENWRNSDL